MYFDLLPPRLALPRFSAPISSFVGLALVILACFLPKPVAAVLVPFDNCLSDSYRAGSGLKWNPLFVDARFDADEPAHNLQIIVWGNVSGSYTAGDIPPANDSAWDNPKEITGKILEQPEGDNLTTLETRVNVLTYQPYFQKVAFCNDSLVNATCPLGPVFNTSVMCAPLFNVLHELS